MTGRKMIFRQGLWVQVAKASAIPRQFKPDPRGEFVHVVSGKYAALGHGRLLDIEWHQEDAA